MDKKIEDLTSTTFAGCRFQKTQIAEIQKTVKIFCRLSRRELAHTICEHFRLTTPAGTNRIQTCLNALEEMESLGIITLPVKQPYQQKNARKKISFTHQTNRMDSIDAPLEDLMPIKLEIAIEKADALLWNEFIDRYHYLGYKRPIGSYLRYYIVDKNQRRLGCLMFCFATTKLTCRDEWIGWSVKQRKKHLNLVIKNNRFLIFPWVNVNNLASFALSLSTKQIADDWQTHHGYRPVLLETFVNPLKYKGTCYKAANWKCIGKTTTVNADNPVAKDVYIYPLHHDVPSALTNNKKSPTKKTQPFKAANIATDNHVFLWQKIIIVVSKVAEKFDKQWQKRQRVLTTLLIILFIFRLVFSKNKQGYGITIAELWEYCHKFNIQLPQKNPVVPAAFCNARAKMDESVFKILNTEIIHTYETDRDDHRFKKHRIFAIDGTKINLPKSLLKCSYQKPSDHAYYPQGLASCLYQLKSGIPFDFELSPNTDERVLALRHLNALQKEDIVVYDRGYFSYVMLHAHYKKEIHAVFRLARNSFKIIDAFIDSTDMDKIVTIHLSPKRQQKILKKHPGLEFLPLQLRLIKYVIAGTTYIIGTTLTDSDRYPISEFPDVYHSRWGVEELYKISKTLIDVEDFHGKTERGVKQELYAHFVMITLAKIFANQTDDILFLQNKPAKIDVKNKTNVKNCLITVARNLEGLFLDQAIRVKNTIITISQSIATCYQKVRPNRSYDRVSHKIEKRWRPKRKKTPATVTAG